jgi:hypothetical protein
MRLRAGAAPSAPAFPAPLSPALWRNGYARALAAYAGGAVAAVLAPVEGPQPLPAPLPPALAALSRSPSPAALAAAAALQWRKRAGVVAAGVAGALQLHHRRQWRLRKPIRPQQRWRRRREEGTIEWRQC